MALKPFDAYRIHNAIHLHFISDYDCFKYQFKTRVTEKAFYKRNDRYFFAKAAHRYNTLEKITDFYASQYADGDMKKHISNFFTEEGDTRYQSFQKKLQSFSFHFTNQMSYLGDKYDTFDKLLEVDGMYPPIISEWMEGSIDTETVVTVNKLTNFVDDINSTDTLLWPDKKRFLKKYGPFVKCDLDKVKKIIINQFTS